MLPIERANYLSLLYVDSRPVPGFLCQREKPCISLQQMPENPLGEMHRVFQFVLQIVIRRRA